MNGGKPKMGKTAGGAGNTMATPKPNRAQRTMAPTVPPLQNGMVPPPPKAIAPMAGAPVGSAAHNAAHAGFRSKQTPVSTDRGNFSFKENRPASGGLGVNKAAMPMGKPGKFTVAD